MPWGKVFIFYNKNILSNICVIKYNLPNLKYSLAAKLYDKKTA
jgi:hypothetical protein